MRKSESEKTSNARGNAIFAPQSYSYTVQLASRLYPNRIVGLGTFNNNFRLVANRFLRRLALLAVLPGLGACTSLYFPPPPNVPLLTQKGEFSGGIHTNLDNNLAIQGAYAVGEHIGAIGTFTTLNTDKKRKAEEHRFAEIGGGYFTRLPDKRALEVYVGLGAGSTKRTDFKTENDIKTVERTVEGDLNKYFLQVNYSSKEKKSFHLFGNDFPVSYGTALRLSYLELSDLRVDGVATTPEDNVFVEPITFTRVQVAGPVQLQLISGGMFGLRSQKYLKASNSVFNFGVVVNIGGQSGKK
ncbi:hypothetical protein [Hymenobacter radiodurans]|uniref:hypothetical protein n=1 Tax=Hymenobacter radiodurans TaxID=2496028 RepID=UPI001058A1D5|nr:hypothetical protein [Hymenobacter radiodurans]